MVQSHWRCRGYGDYFDLCIWTYVKPLQPLWFACGRSFCFVYEYHLAVAIFVLRALKNVTRTTCPFPFCTYYGRLGHLLQLHIDCILCISLNSIPHCRLRDFVKSQRRVLRRAEIQHFRIAARTGLCRWRQGVRNVQMIRRACGTAKCWLRERMCGAAVAALEKTAHLGTTSNR